MKKWLFIIFALIVISGAVTGCKSTPDTHNSSSIHPVPENTDDGWQTASLSAVGMSEEPFVSLMNTISQNDENLVHSILVVKDGKLVFEQYFGGKDILVTDKLEYLQKDFDRDTPHCMASASKSVTSILFGIAKDNGKIPDLEESIFNYFPEYADLNNSTRQKITLRHLLTMTSGITWSESNYSYEDSRNDLHQMVFSDDPIRNYLGKEQEDEPGEKFNYSSGTTNVIGEIIHRATGQTLIDYANQYLFTPLGIKNFQWQAFPSNPDIAVATALLYLRPRDMAKIGQLYLQKGTWNGQHIVSEAWVEESTGNSIEVPYEDNPNPQLIESYGYQWWRGTFSNGNVKTFFAAGHGGQFIFVLPDLNTVVVLTGGHYGGSYSDFYDIVNLYVIPSIDNSEFVAPTPSEVYISIPVDPNIITNLRSGPGTNFSIVGALEQGKEIKVIGSNNKSGEVWFLIEPGKWVAKRAVNVIRGNIAQLPVIETP
jgi:CubicO group peptidase (beta-lactamase class C family)